MAGLVGARRGRPGIDFVCLLVLDDHHGVFDVDLLRAKVVDHDRRVHLDPEVGLDAVAAGAKTRLCPLLELEDALRREREVPLDGEIVLVVLPGRVGREPGLTQYQDGGACCVVELCLPAVPAVEGTGRVDVVGAGGERDLVGGQARACDLIDDDRVQVADLPRA